MSLSLNPIQPVYVDDSFAADVVAGLTSEPKKLLSKYHYDILGSKLFESICELPWYTITRGECTLLERIKGNITDKLRDPVVLAELGPGNGDKVAILAKALDAECRETVIHLIDVSEGALNSASRTLEPYSSVKVRKHKASYIDGLRNVIDVVEPSESLTLLFLGSNIGNLDPQEADRFLIEVRALLRVGDKFVIGTDLIKPVEQLLLAYDDPLGVTRAFNRNLLVRINRELEADFEVDQYDFQVKWNSRISRIESYLVSRRDQTVCIGTVNRCVRFVKGDIIWTESSHKYESAEVAEMGRAAGFECQEQWVEPTSEFLITCFGVR